MPALHLTLRRLPTPAILLALSLAACSGTAATPSASAAGTPAATAARSSAAGSGASAGASPAAAKVSANSATESEIAAALAAVGVPNADRWAREVTEYRPYPSDDPSLQKLQDNLAKYNPDPATLAGILSALLP